MKGCNLRFTHFFINELYQLNHLGPLADPRPRRAACPPGRARGRALGLKAGGFLGRSRLRLRKPRTRLPNGRPLVCPGNSDSFRFPSTLLLGVVRIPHGLKKAFSWFLAWFACLLLAYSTFQPLLLLVVF